MHTLPPLFFIERWRKHKVSPSEWQYMPLPESQTFWCELNVSKTAILSEGLAPAPVLSSLSAVVVYIQTATSGNTLQSGKQEKPKTTKHGLEVVENNHV